MAYTIHTQGSGKSLIILLKNEETNISAEIFAFGAILNRFEIRKEGKNINVIRAYDNPEEAQRHIAPLFYGAKLNPFVCRLANAAFEFEGTAYHIRKYFSGKSALHGLLYDAGFALSGQDIHSDSASVELSYRYDSTAEGFPFPYSIKVQYTLSGNKLSVRTTVLNEGTTDMPLSDGWHPYFQLGGSIDEAEITFRSENLVVFDDSLLPTGETRPYSEFARFKSLKGVELDNSFTLKEENTPALQLRNASVGLQVNIWPEASYPILQIYTPPERDSIAIENLSSIPDAFNNKKGLISAKPRVEYVFATAYEIVGL